MRCRWISLSLFALGCSGTTPTVEPDDVVILPTDARVDAAVSPPRDAPDVVTVRSDASLTDALADALPPADLGAPADSGSSDVPSVSFRTVLRVHYPMREGSIALRGSSQGLNWDSGQSFRYVGDGVWEWTSEAVRAPIEWKPLLDDRTWSRGPNYTVNAGETAEVWPHFVNGIGTWSRRWPAVRSVALGNTRGVWAYLPPTYGENPQARFPVVYMHDGQNLFDPSAAFGGNIWQIARAMDTGAEDGSIHEAVVIGVENTSARIEELTPTRDASQMLGGRGDLYLQMLTGEIKPMVDRELHTLADREHTAVMGSSLGGLISVYAGVRRAEVFGLVGALSPSTWWDSRVILGEVGGLSMRASRPLRFYVDSGDSGPSSDDVANTRMLAAALRSVGYSEGSTLRYVVQAGGMHNEVYWAQRVPGALAFLLGPRERLPAAH